MTTVYKNANGGAFDIVVENGRIAHLGTVAENGIDLHGRKVFAGLIDVHSHGCIGLDTMDGDGLREMSRFQAKNGVTAWLPTTMTMDDDAIRRVTNVPLTQTENGAQVLGFHMEGPYIAERYKGAQNAAFIQKPSCAHFGQFDNVKMVTVAPELDGALDFIQHCDAVVSLGHTACDYETACRAIEAGAKCLTHTCNAMPPLHHRETGPIGAAAESGIYAQLICDGLHVHKSMVLALYRMFGVDRLVLISDSMRATGMGDGKYEFGGQTMTVTNGVARTADGALAGSTSTLLDCVKTAISFGIPETDAFAMASHTPAQLLGLNKGKLAVGYDADFIAVDDDYNVVHTVIGGTMVR